MPQQQQEVVEAGDDFGSQSDASQEENPSGKSFKRQRRLHGACDACKRKKTKCDSAIMPNNICTNCINGRVQCTRTIPRQKKRDKQQERISELEDKIRELEGRLSAASSPSADHDGAGADSGTDRFSSPDNVAPTQNLLSPPLPQSLAFTDSAGLTSVEVKYEDWDPSDPNDLAEQVMRLSIDVDQGRFFGKSSLLNMISQVVVAKTQSTEQSFVDFANLKRSALWDLRPWEREYAESERPTYNFPEPDLSEMLLQAFRENVHIQLPAIHWPSFMRDYRSGKHHNDPGFGMLLLAVFATASRFVDDDRVLIIDPDHPELSGPSAGWRFIAQTPLLRRSLIRRVEIVDLQYYAITGFYFLGSSSPQVAWPLIGVAMRFAIEKGMHRHTMLRPKTRAQGEMEKRVFWCLITLEWLTSASLGRPACLHDEDIDIEYPSECDDEYWESEVDDPAQAYVQPAGKPSMLTAFVFHLKLCEIAAFMQRTLYSTKKSKLLSGRVGEQWEMRIVSQLDSAMNKWKDSLPQHLRWDPNAPDLTFFNQQILIHAAFYYLQIQVHRPFLKPKTALSLPGLALCTNAARACSHLAGAAMKRTRFSAIIVFVSAFAASTVLAINFWARDRRLSYNPQRELSDMLQLLKFLRMGERRWHLVGRFADMVTEFTSIGGHPIELSEAGAHTKKRSRGGQPVSTDMDASPPPANDAPLSTNLSSSAWPSASGVEPYPPSARTSSSAPRPFTQTQPQHRPQPPQQQQPKASTSQLSIPNPDAPLGDFYQTDRTTPQLSFSTDWDLSNLILAQIGYGDNGGNGMFARQMNPTTPSTSGLNMNMHNGFHGQGGLGHGNAGLDALGMMQRHLAGVDGSGAVGPGTLPPGFEDLWMGSAQTQGTRVEGVAARTMGAGVPGPSGLASPDAMSIWQSAPSAFSIEEWDSYLTSLNQPSQPLTGPGF